MYRALRCEEVLSLVWRPPVAAPDREFCENEVRGKYRKPPHLPVVGAGNSFDPGPARLRHEAKRGALWRRQPLIGEEIGRCSRHNGCFLNTARSAGTDIRKGRGAGSEAQKNRGPRGSAVRWGGGGRSRTLGRKSTGFCRSRHRFLENTMRSSGRQGGVVPQEESPRWCGRGEAVENIIYT